MPFTQRDAQAATYLARRLREETKGARIWDEAGTYAKVAELVGQNLELSLERILRHAADPDAKTPGAIHRPFVPPAGSEKPRPSGPPKSHEACGRCGGFKGVCPCSRVDQYGTDDEPTVPLQGDPRALARAAVRAAQTKTATEETA